MMLIALIFMGCLLYLLATRLVCLILAGGNLSDPAPDGPPPPGTPCTCAAGRCALHPFSVVSKLRVDGKVVPLRPRCDRAPGPFSPSPKGNSQ